MRVAQKPCIDCGTLALATRCKRCEAIKQKIRNSRRTHYRGAYKKQAAEVRATATSCWICGGGARFDDPFTADHVVPAESDSLLLPAHRSCNSRRGDATRSVANGR